MLDRGESRCLVIAVGVFLAAAGGASASAATSISSLAIPAWEQTDRIADNLGASLDVEGQTVLVGNAFDRCETWAGAFVLERDGPQWARTELKPGDDNPDGECRGFGEAVALDDQAALALVGDPGYDTADQKNAGSAYVFRATPEGWQQDAKLTADLPGDDRYSGIGPQFGEEVAVSGDRIAVSAPYAFDSQGAVLVYEDTPDGWNLEERLVGDVAPGGDFGTAVDLDGETLAVGASDADRVFLFEHRAGEWTQTAELVPAQDEVDKPPSTTCFGFSLALDGDWLVVGEPCWTSVVEAYGSQKWSGRAEVFAATDAGWELDRTLTARDGTQGEQFGINVGLSGDTLIVGAPHDPVFYTHEGAAYVFERSEEWERTAKLEANDTGRYDMLGYAVDVSGRLATIAAPFDDNRGDDAPKPLRDHGNLPHYGSSGLGAGSVYTFEPTERAVSLSVP